MNSIPSSLCQSCGLSYASVLCSVITLSWECTCAPVHFNKVFSARKSIQIHSSQAIRINGILCFFPHSLFPHSLFRLCYRISGNAIYLFTPRSRSWAYKHVHINRFSKWNWNRLENMFSLILFGSIADHANRGLEIVIFVYIWKKRRYFRKNVLFHGERNVVKKLLLFRLSIFGAFLPISTLMHIEDQWH